MRNLMAKLKAAVERARARVGALDVALETFRRFSADDGGPLAAALTYYTFLSIFPLLLVGAATLGYLTFGNAELRADLLAAGLDAAPLLRDLLSPEGLETIEGSRRSLALGGAALALYSGSGAVMALQHGLNRMAHVAEEGTILQRRIRSLRWMIFLGLAAIASLVSSSIAAFAGDVMERLTTAGELVTEILARAGGIGVSLLLFASAFRFLPRTSWKMRDVLPGAIAASIAFEVLKVAGTLYLARGESARNDTFGAFAGAAALLVSSHLLAQITLLSAELNHVLAERRAKRAAGGPGPRTDRVASAGGGTMQRDTEHRVTGNGAGEKSAGQLMKEVTRDLSTLVRKEVQLAKEEVGSAVAAKAKGGAIVAVGGVFAFFALIFVLLTVRDAIALALPVWAADLATAGGLLALGGLAVVVARKKLATRLDPELSKRSLREDVEMAKHFGRR